MFGDDDGMPTLHPLAAFPTARLQFFLQGKGEGMVSPLQGTGFGDSGLEPHSGALPARCCVLSAAACHLTTGVSWWWAGLSRR